MFKDIKIYLLRWHAPVLQKSDRFKWNIQVLINRFWKPLKSILNRWKFTGHLGRDNGHAYKIWCNLVMHEPARRNDVPGLLCQASAESVKTVSADWVLGSSLNKDLISSCAIPLRWSILPSWIICSFKPLWNRHKTVFILNNPKSVWSLCKDSSNCGH
jgi:hypothetical protein